MPFERPAQSLKSPRAQKYGTSHSPSFAHGHGSEPALADDTPAPALAGLTNEEHETHAAPGLLGDGVARSHAVPPAV